MVALPPRPRILIVRLSAIGDTILTTPVARQLRRLHPDAWIAWLVGRKAYPVVAANPHLDEVLVLDERSPASWLSTIRRLHRRFDMVIDAQCLLKSCVLTWFSRAPVRVGRESARHRRGWGYTHLAARLPDDALRYVAQVYLHQCAHLGVDPEDFQTEFTPGPSEREWAARCWDRHGLGADPKAVALIPFASVAGNEWAPNRFAEVGDALAAEFGIRSVMLGGPTERTRAEALAARMTSAPLVLAGETSLGQTAAVIERCVLAIGGDTGLSHCAFACRVPLVFIQGSSPPCNAPKGDRTAHLLALCDDRPCPKDTRCKRGEGRPCLEAITVPQVLEACRALLTGAGTAPAYRSAPT